MSRKVEENFIISADVSVASHPACKVRIASSLYTLLKSLVYLMWDLGFSQYTPLTPNTLWAWCVNRFRWPLNSTSSDTILEIVVEPNTTPQNRLVRWGLPPLYILFSRVLSIWCGTWVFLAFSSIPNYLLPIN